MSQSASGQRRVSNASNRQELHQGMMEWIAESDLSEGSKNLLRNLLSKELVMGYFKAAELNEWRWKLRRKKEMFFAMHPDEKCEVTGQDRAAIYGDPTATLSPLSDEQRMVVRDMFDVLEARITRARDMAQQEMLNTDIHEQRDGTQGEEGPSSGGLRGWLGS